MTKPIYQKQASEADIPGRIGSGSSKLVEILSQYLGGTPEKFFGTTDDFHLATCEINGCGSYGIYMPDKGKRFPVIGMRKAEFYIIKHEEKGKIELERITEDIHEGLNMYPVSKKELLTKTGMRRYVEKICQTKPVETTQKEQYIKREAPDKSQEALDLENRIEKKSQSFSENIEYNKLHNLSTNIPHSTLKLNVKDMQTLVNIGYRVNKYDRMPLGWNDSSSETIEFHNGETGISLIALPDPESTIPDRERRTYRFALLNNQLQPDDFDKIISKPKTNLGLDWTAEGYKVLDDITRPNDEISKVGEIVIQTLDTKVERPQDIFIPISKITKNQKTASSEVFSDYVSSLKQETASLESRVNGKKAGRTAEQVEKSIDNRDYPLMADLLDDSVSPLKIYNTMMVKGFVSLPSAANELVEYRDFVDFNKIMQVLNLYDSRIAEKYASHIIDVLDLKKTSIIPKSSEELNSILSDEKRLRKLAEMIMSEEDLEIAKLIIEEKSGTIGWDTINSEISRIRSESR